MMNCLVDARQLNKPTQDKTLTEPIFSIDASIHYEVHYLPDNLYMNLKSYRQTVSFPLHNDHLGRTLFTTLLSRTLIPESNFSSILVSVFSKLKVVASDSRNSGYNFIPLSMSIRVVSTQHFNLESQRTIWQRMLDTPGKISSRTPAIEKSVRELEKVVYNGEDSGLECAICLKEFKVGEEMTMMPCFHCYHGNCVVKWLKKSHQCPSCRFPLPVCRVVEGSFPFYKRNHCRKVLPRAEIGRKIRKTARMCTRFQVY